jgi:mannitol operon repressor
MAPRRKRDRAETTLRSQDLQGFNREFQKESDRATAVLGAALLDEKLLQLLTAFLIDDTKQIALLLDTEQPLGSFGARIRVAYCLGLITKPLFELLTVVKGIRNAFAHQLHGLSFGSPDISKDCSSLRSIMRVPDGLLDSPRIIFLSATLSAQTELWAMTTSIEASQRRCKVPEWKTLVHWRGKDAGA